MIKFLLTGLWRDKSRSRLPVMVVAVGVALSVFMHAYITGIMGELVEQTANFSGGHVKVMSAAYAAEINQRPNDLALMNADSLMAELNTEFDEIVWVPRIVFGGLADAPDSNGETKSQGPVIGMAIDFVRSGGAEAKRLNLEKSLVSGHIPYKTGEVLLSDDFAKKLMVKAGDKITLISTTMYGGMSFTNFTLSGTVRFGYTGMDRGTMLARFDDVQQALEMDNAVSEIFGFFKSGYYHDDAAQRIKEDFALRFKAEGDEYAPVLQTLRDKEGMSINLEMTKSISLIIMLVFIMAMSLVLWNAGLLGALRRYGEVGVRLAIGEEKGHVYRTMIYESLMVGITGSILGTGIGLFAGWLLQHYGLDISQFTKNASMGIMMPDKVHARITPPTYIVGFLPGIFSTLLGSMLAGIGIYKRKTAQLFKELET